MHALQNDTGEVWADRDRLLVDVRRMASELLALADGAAARSRARGLREPEELAHRDRMGMGADNHIVDRIGERPDHLNRLGDFPR
jgi:hypothetical protein